MLHVFFIGSPAPVALIFRKMFIVYFIIKISYLNPNRHKPIGNIVS